MPSLVSALTAPIVLPGNLLNNACATATPPPAPTCMSATTCAPIPSAWQAPKREGVKKETNNI